MTTFNALRNAGGRPGDLVAVQGIGGLGHLGVQFANRMGFRVAAVARGAEKEPLAKELGAHHYIDSSAEDAAAALQALGGASVILTTATSGKAMSSLIGGLRAGSHDRRRRESGSDRTEPRPIIIRRGAVEGSLTGSPLDGEETLAFSLLTGIRPKIETMPLEAAAEAYAKMMRNEARFRMVLLTGQ